jgi:DNA-binding XRE family transcriptional regulator
MQRKRERGVLRKTLLQNRSHPSKNHSNVLRLYNASAQHLCQWKLHEMNQAEARRGVKGPANRIRQARRHAGKTQGGLAAAVGVHRSAVAQWEKPGGPHPTVENLARISISTGTSFEWLATGRGRMVYASDLLPGD